MKKWTCSESPELIPIPVESKRYNQILAEIAELLYDHWASSPQINSSFLAHSIESYSVEDSRTQTPHTRAAEGTTHG